jgi:indolepyruvate ferredoxin oxidoreductase
LFNDAVAMTGGQHHEGNLTPDMIARQVRAEGVARIAIVSDEPDKYGSETSWPAHVTFNHRSDLMLVQKELAEIPGVTVMIYDQTCAAEKRRRRKRGLMPDPDKRVLINELVCEGCGDCGTASNCVSVQPLETEFGRKRKIDQSNCNKDFSCIDGFCPSFVTVSGAKPRKSPGMAKGQAIPNVPDPIIPDLDVAPWAAVVTGIGGTGVVTIGAILGMAAHLEGRGCGMIDMAGLAQKGGAVYSHVRLAATPDDIHAIRVSAGMADLILGCDLVVSGSKKVLGSVKPGETVFVVNTAEVLPGDFTRNPDFSLPGERIKRSISNAAGDDHTHFLDASRIATTLFGQSIAANMFLLGFAYQKGAVPLHANALEQAILMNGEAVAMNTEAFRWGRVAAHDLTKIDLSAASGPRSEAQRLSTSLDEIIARRMAFLTEYQNADYAQSYRQFVELVRAKEATFHAHTALSEKVARNLFKLMAYKDEYEVARLYAGDAFRRQLSEAFEGDQMRLTFHLAPPLFAPKNADTGHPRKLAFGAWMLPVFGVLAKLKGLRGTPFDLFGYSAERKDERARITHYRALIEQILARLTVHNHALCVSIAALPEGLRGFGHVKAKHAKQVDAEEKRLLAQLEQEPSAQTIAAE